MMTGRMVAREWERSEGHEYQMHRNHHPGAEESCCWDRLREYVTHSSCWARRAQQLPKKPLHDFTEVTWVRMRSRGGARVIRVRRLVAEGEWNASKEDREERGMAEVRTDLAFDVLPQSLPF